MKMTKIKDKNQKWQKVSAQNRPQMKETLDNACGAI